MQTLSPPAAAHFLGAARVVRIDGPRLLLSANETQAWAANAVGYPYDFQPDDVVLAIAHHDEWYVIGVLQGSGKLTLRAPGDLRLLAPQGAIELVSAQGITLRSPQVSVVTLQWKLVARKISQRCEQARLWIKHSWDVVAQRMTARVEGGYRLRAGKIVQRAEGDVKIDGKKIHLG